MAERRVINTQYYCERAINDPRISVFTGNSYLVAEYSERSGETRWQRVVAAAQKDGITEWLKQHFPPLKVEVPAAKPVRRKAAAAR
jgi:hypothetical protein